MTQLIPGPNGHVYLVSAARTPIGKFGGAFAAVPAVELGGVAIRAAVERAGLDPTTVQIDDVLMGQVLQGGVGQAPARQAVLRAGLPDTTPATTINRVCGSGLKAIMLAAAEIPVLHIRTVCRRPVGSINSLTARSLKTEIRSFMGIVPSTMPISKVGSRGSIVARAP